MSALHFERIAHPTDFSSESESAFLHALRLAAAAGSSLDLVHVAEAPQVVTPELFPSAESTLEQWGLEEEPSELTRVAAQGKKPVGPILEYLDESLPDFLVLATHRRRGLARWLRTAVAQKVQRDRALPTLFVPVGEEGFISASTGRVYLRRILIPIAWMPPGQPALDAALELSRTLGASPLEVTVLHCGASDADFPPVELPQTEGVEVVRSLREGEPKEQIVRAADELSADLVIMVTEGRHGFLEALRGSTTEQVLRELHCPLLVMPDPNH
ncbi:MAG: universal stress protein [Acidobacteriota bacterium]